MRRAFGLIVFTLLFIGLPFASSAAAMAGDDQCFSTSVPDQLHDLSRGTAVSEYRPEIDISEVGLRVANDTLTVWVSLAALPEKGGSQAFSYWISPKVQQAGPEMRQMEVTIQNRAAYDEARVWEEGGESLGTYPTNLTGNSIFISIPMGDLRKFLGSENPSFGAPDATAEGPYVLQPARIVTEELAQIDFAGDREAFVPLSPCNASPSTAVPAPQAQPVREVPGLQLVELAAAVAVLLAVRPRRKQ